MGVIYVKENQFSEEQILDNNDNSPLFDEFLQLLGDKVRLRGFDKYKGGLDTVHDLTGNFYPWKLAAARVFTTIYKILLIIITKTKNINHNNNYQPKPLEKRLYTM